MGGTSIEVDNPVRYDWSDSPSVTKKRDVDYARDDRRVYTGYRSRGLPPPRGMEISSDSLYAETLVVDVTGSMRSKPELILKKSSVLYEETNAVLQGYGPEEMRNKKDPIPDELEMNIIAIGDARCDEHPLQVTPFKKRGGVVEEINKIYPEGGGGGTLEESYELGLYFLLKHCKVKRLPNNTKPLCIIFGDEGFYDFVDRIQVRDQIGDELEKDMRTADVIEQLKRKFDIRLFRPELSYTEYQYRRVNAKWEKVLGPGKVRKLDDPDRIVDVIVGVNAEISNNWEKGLEILKRRQTEAQVREVVKALHPSAA